MSISTTIKSIQDVMRQDSGVDGDAQRISQLVWMLFLKLFDANEEVYEWEPDYQSPIPENLRWRQLAADDEGLTGEGLLDGSLFGEGVKTRIKERLLETCNLHTIVRLPNGVFNPYTGIKTNLLFFRKGEPTEAIWYFDHPIPPDRKHYSKTRPFTIEEFALEKAWWGEHGDGYAARVESEHAWQVPIDEIKKRGYNLDIKNPHAEDEALGDPAELLAAYEGQLTKVANIRIQLRDALARHCKKQGHCTRRGRFEAKHD